MGSRVQAMMFTTRINLALIVILSCSGAIDGSPMDSIVLFGDSLSDNGNGYAGNAKFVLRTNQTFPEAPYYQGRWSNGPTWIEVVASSLGVSLTDYGAGGATTGSAPAQVPPLPSGFGGLTVPFVTLLSPSLPQQLNAHFLVTNNTLSAAPLYFIFIGANDYFSIVFQNTSVTAPIVTGYISDAMQQLYSRGARKFVLVEEPDITGIPAFTQHSTYGYYPASAIKEMGAQVTQHNKLLLQLAQTFPASHSGATVHTYDFGAAFSQVAKNASLGFTDTTTACYVTADNLAQNSQPATQPIGSPNGALCSSPDAHVFWDQFHPTRVVHRRIAELFLNQTGSTLFGIPSH